MTTPDEFRLIALGLPGTTESAHMGHADFRAGDKVFATLGHPDASWGMVKLTLEDQALRVEAEPDVFVPAAGAWGRAGSTKVRLDAIDNATLLSALTAAWRARSAKPAKRR